MDEPEYICTFCDYQFDLFVWDRDLPPICPRCGDKDIITTEQARENERINAQETWNESWRE